MEHLKIEKKSPDDMSMQVIVPACSVAESPMHRKTREKLLRIGRRPVM